MSTENIQNLEIGLSVRNKLNNNFTETYSTYTTISSTSATWSSKNTDYFLGSNSKRSVTTFGVTMDDSEKWYGAVLATDGNLYCTPYNATDILVINTKQKTATRTNFGSAILTGSAKYKSAVLAKNKKIYCAPHSTTNILITDPINKTITRTNFNLSLPSSNAFSSAILGFDDKVYLVPNGTNSRSIVIIDPATSTATATNFGYLNKTSRSFGRAVINRQGNICGRYFTTSNASGFYKINPEIKTISETGISTTTLPVSLGVNNPISLMADGFNVIVATYDSLFNDTVMGRYNTESNVLEDTAVGGYYTIRNIILAPDGYMYAISQNSTFPVVVNGSDSFSDEIVIKDDRTDYVYQNSSTVINPEEFKDDDLFFGANDYTANYLPTEIENKIKYQALNIDIEGNIVGIPYDARFISITEIGTNKDILSNPNRSASNVYGKLPIERCISAYYNKI